MPVNSRIWKVLKEADCKDSERNRERDINKRHFLLHLQLNCFSWRHLVCCLFLAGNVVVKLNTNTLELP